MTAAIERPKPPRWVRLVVVVVLAGLCLLAVAVGWMLARLWPVPTGAAALGFAAGFALCARHIARLLVERDEARDLLDMLNNSEARDDLAEVGPVTGEVPRVQDDTGPGTVAHLCRPYDQAAEIVLCAWCPEPAVGRLDVTVGVDTWRDLPACATCPDLIRVGDLDPASALPDMAASVYGSRLA